MSLGTRPPSAAKNPLPMVVSASPNSRIRVTAEPVLRQARGSGRLTSLSCSASFLAHVGVALLYLLFALLPWMQTAQLPGTRTVITVSASLSSQAAPVPAEPVEIEMEPQEAVEVQVAKQPTSERTSERPRSEFPPLPPRHDMGELQAEARPSERPLDAPSMEAELPRLARKTPSQSQPLASLPAISAQQALGTDETPAQPLYNPPPVYPPDAVLRGSEGRVTLHVSIDSKGLVVKVRIQESSGDRLLDEAAAAAVRTWRFRPAQRGTFGIASTVLLPVRFRL